MQFDFVPDKQQRHRCVRLPVAIVRARVITPRLIASLTTDPVISRNSAGSAASALLEFAGV
jgi:hypothetical protein